MALSGFSGKLKNKVQHFESLALFPVKSPKNQVAQRRSKGLQQSKWEEGGAVWAKLLQMSESLGCETPCRGNTSGD